MAGLFLVPGFQPALDSDGFPIAGARIYAFLNDTTTLAPIFTDLALTIAAANPVIANASGVFPPVYAADDSVFSAYVTDAQGAPLASYDDVPLSAPTGFALNTLANLTPAAIANLLANMAPAGAQGLAGSVDTIAALSALTMQNGAVVVVRGYHAPGDLGGGVFHFVAGSTATVDGGLVFAGVGGRWLRQIEGGDIHLRWFGAQDETQATTDQVPAILAWYAAVAFTGRRGRIDAATYTCLTAMTWDLSAVEAVGLTIEGDGTQRSILDFTRCTTSPNFQVICTTAPENDFYVALRGFGIEGNIAGKVLQIGQENFVDPLNEPVFDLYVSNTSQSASAVAVEINFVTNGELRFVANGNNAGSAAVFRRVEFSDIFGSYGNANIALDLTGSYTFGNTFHSLDLEVCNFCVVCDTASNIMNTFIGGQWNYSVNGLNVSAGSVLVINPNCAPQGAATITGFLTGTAIATGTVEVIGPNIILVTTPAMPASGAALANATGQTVTVEIWGGSVSSYSIDGGAARTVAAGQFFSVQLRPGDQIVLTYSAAPTWLWRRG